MPSNLSPPGKDKPVIEPPGRREEQKQYLNRQGAMTPRNQNSDRKIKNPSLFLANPASLCPEDQFAHLVDLHGVMAPWRFDSCIDSLGVSAVNCA
jgi:hypothetical protein